MSSSLGRDRSILNCSLSLWLVVNWLLLGVLPGQFLLSFLINWTLSGVLWIKSSLLLEVRFIGLELLSFLKVCSSIPVVIHVSELIMDLLDLFVGQSIRFSIDQALDGSKLVDENELWVVFVVVDSIEIGLEELLIQHV